MTDRSYRLITGALLLVFLYFDFYALIAALIAFQLFEGVTNLRAPILMNKMGFGSDALNAGSGGIVVTPISEPIPFDAERAWRIVLAFGLFIALFVFPQHLWFLPWFVGFALVGAGLSGVCPMLISLKFLGFR